MVAPLRGCKAGSPRRHACSPEPPALGAGGWGHTSLPWVAPDCDNLFSRRLAPAVIAPGPRPLPTGCSAAAAAWWPAAGPRPRVDGRPGSCRHTPGSHPPSGSGRAVRVGREPQCLRPGPQGQIAGLCRPASPGPWTVGSQAPRPARRPAPSSTPCRGRSRQPLRRRGKAAELHAAAQLDLRRTWGRHC